MTPEEQDKTAATAAVNAKTDQDNIDYKDVYLRARADYENLLKEQEKKRKEWVEFANLGLLQDLIPVIEHFHQGMKYVPADVKTENWMIGFAQIKKQLDAFMAGNNLERMVAVGKQFDSMRHEAVGKRSEKEKQPDEILEEVMGGYLLHGKVVQPAKVIVNEIEG